MRFLLALIVSLAWPAAAGSAGVCLGPSITFGENGTVDCDVVDPQLWDHHVIGYSQFDVPCEYGPPCGLVPPGSNSYGWTISASETDPFVNSGALPAGIAHLYLWLTCAPDDGVGAAEFTVEVDDPSLILLASTMQNGFLNASLNQPEELLLAVGGCPHGPVLAVDLLVFNTNPVSVDSESWTGIKSMFR